MERESGLNCSHCRFVSHRKSVSELGNMDPPVPQEGCLPEGAYRPTFVGAMSADHAADVAAAAVVHERCNPPLSRRSLGIVHPVVCWANPARSNEHTQSPSIHWE